VQANSNTLAAHIDTLIRAADAERWLEWHGPVAEREQHRDEADALLEQLRRVSVDWSRGREAHE
jgi:hypothetical protein